MIKLKIIMLGVINTSKAKTPYNPTPGDYDVEKLAGTRPETSHVQDRRDNIAPTKNLNPLSTDGPNKNIISSTSSKSQQP